jgi:hypothetical protein
MQAGNYFFWVPWLLPHVGALLGSGIYKLMIELHHPPEKPPSLPN